MVKNSKDYIFNEDELITQLTRQQTGLLTQLCDLVGRQLNPVLIGDEPEQQWSSEAKDLFDRYRKLSWELSRRHSRQSSMQLTRLMSGFNGEEKITAEMMRFWMNRY